MTAQKLNEKFGEYGKSNRHFIEWAERMTGQVFHGSEVSQHRNGKRPMSRYAKSVYVLYFLLMEKSLL